MGVNTKDVENSLLFARSIPSSGRADKRQDIKLRTWDIFISVVKFAKSFLFSKLSTFFLTSRTIDTLLLPSGFYLSI